MTSSLAFGSLYPVNPAARSSTMRLDEAEDSGNLDEFRLRFREMNDVELVRFGRACSQKAGTEAPTSRLSFGLRKHKPNGVVGIEALSRNSSLALYTVRRRTIPLCRA